jgi:hypothetical protein
MSASGYGDEQLRKLIRDLEDEKARLKAQKARSEADINNRLADVDGRLRRAKMPLPNKDSCPVCWIDHGKRSKMQPQSPGRGVVDFRCGECGNTETRR